MIQTTLAYEQKRQTGQPPQVGLFVQLLNTTLVIVAAGFEGLDAGAFFKFDGTRKYDGTWQYGSDVQLIARGLVSLSELVEGDDAGGDPRSPMLPVLPSRKVTLSAEIDNTTGLLAELLANEPFIGKRVQARLTYPGLVAADMPVRFSGQIAREVVTTERVTLEMRSA